VGNLVAVAERMQGLPAGARALGNVEGSERLSPTLREAYQAARAGAGQSVGRAKANADVSSARVIFLT
jgi:hypothetical protein